ncbi:hypothetical protein LWI28_009737 [Acer negundo]|uniref:Gag/pol protein n=1 Tax=Acer negundo TaxID=4023 RepID=A0AAD5IZB4_ACENE|nr:hypothetical protein LWI28_009737 [Acer negundo]
MTTALDIIESLQAMFEQPSEQKRHEAVRFVMLARMKKGSSIREHVLGVMSHFNLAEVNGEAINEFSLTQLLNELTTFEFMAKNHKGKTGETNVTYPSSSGLKKRKMSTRKAKAKPKKKPTQSKKNSTSTDKAKGKCLHCDKVGH